MLLTWQEEASQCRAKRGALMQTVSPTESHKSSQVPTAQVFFCHQVELGESSLEQPADNTL